MVALVPLFGASAINRISAEPAETMRVIYHSHWTIVARARIEVQANGEHSQESRWAAERGGTPAFSVHRSIAGDVAATALPLTYLIPRGTIFADD